METFWMVYRDGGEGTPTLRHNTLVSAQKEAERLARSMPAERFIVLEAIAACRFLAVAWEKLTAPEGTQADFNGIPF